MESSKFHRADGMFEEGEPPEAAIKHAKAKAEREIAREKAKEDAEHKRVEDIKDERQRVDARVSQQRDRELELKFAMENSVRKSRAVLKDLDYANLPENFIPDGMAVMETTRIRHRRDGYVEKTREERKRLRDAAMARAATARRQKSEAIQMLGDSAIGARTFSFHSSSSLAVCRSFSEHFGTNIGLSFDENPEVMLSDRWIWVCRAGSSEGCGGCGEGEGTAGG